MNSQSARPEIESESPDAKLEIDDSVQRNRLNQIFNTALVSSYSEADRGTATEIQTLMSSPGFGAILQSIQLLAGEQGISEMDAAQELIRTFRRMDRLWTDYLISEGAERLKTST
jgi:hypothetical protein